jgi:hypothetical protein
MSEKGVVWNLSRRAFAESLTPYILCLMQETLLFKARQGEGRAMQETLLFKQGKGRENAEEGRQCKRHFFLSREKAGHS